MSAPRMPDARSVDPRRLLTRAGVRVGLRWCLIALAVLVAALLAGHEFELHLEAIEAWITGLGPWAVLTFVALYVLAGSALVPDTLLCLLAGALFGLAWGIAAVLLGSLLAATLQYALAHRALRARIQRYLVTRPFLAAVQRAVRSDAFRLQVLLRLSPLNPALISYLLGAAGVRFPGFLVASLALAPHMLVEVYLGHAGHQAARVAGRAAIGDDSRVVVLVGLVIVYGALLLWVSKLVRKLLLSAVAESAPTTPDGSFA